MKNKSVKKLAVIGLCTVLAAAPAATIFALDQAASLEEAPGQPPSKPGEGEENPGGPGQEPGGPGGGSSSVVYQAVKTISEDTEESGKTYDAAEADTSALLVTGSTVTEDGLTVTKTGDASSGSGDNSNFYGQNAAVLAKDGAVLTIKNATIESSASGANGVFSYGGNGGKNGAEGDGTTVIISDSTITTTGSGSGGIMTTGGGTTIASNLTIETSGQSSAAIRTDRGGGTVTVEGGTYKTNGLGSPAVYSTADISVSGATLTSTQSEGVVIEGKNSVTLTDTDLYANNTNTNGNATHYDTVFLYQSMSGDADTGTASFTMTGGSITSKNGEVFHVASTDAEINLNNVAITNEDSDNVLLNVSNDGWSSNGNNAVLNAENQKLNGNIVVSSAATSKADADSSLTLVMKNSTYSGAVNTEVASSDQGTVDITLDSGSVWVLSADSYVTSVSGDGKVNYNGHTLYVNGNAYTAENPCPSIGSTTETIADDADPQDDTKAVEFQNTTKTYKASKLKKSKKTFSVIKASDGGKVSVTAYGSKAAKKYIKVSSKGKITVKKGTPKGTYQATIHVDAKGEYREAESTICVKVK